MKFSDIAKGIAAERPLEVELFGKPQRMLVRPLSNDEEVDCCAYAIAFAKERNAPGEDGNDVYDSGLMSKTVALAFLDPDSPPKAREPYFASPEEVRSLDTDTVAMLYEHQELWQKECSPGIRHTSPGQVLDIIRSIAAQAEQDPLAFLKLSPPTRTVCFRTMAVLLVSSHVLKPSSTSSDVDSDSSSSESRGSETRSPEPSKTVPEGT